ncbi:unnamed protein product [Caenorhabditis angaria]|uniref:Uncharacterized protein n=1 Tax=Caenorhabditis angaria TaxID=860376 RepID=A0A9P1N6L4_9PELO|nr:unnamed protein product [Caenorhabditis angaria]
MSTSTIVAQTDLSKQLPSCSYSTTKSGPNRYDLDVDSWTTIFETVASSVPLKKALEFKTLHSVAYRAVTRAFKNVTKLKIEIFKGTCCIQDSWTKNRQTAVEMARYVMENSKIVRVLEIYFDDPCLDVVNEVLDEIVKSNHIRLESLRVKRRHAGQSLPKIAEIIRANAKTLKEITRIGVSEAALGFCDELDLEIFGCMSFDLGFQPNPQQISLNFCRIMESGAKFKKFSYTSFDGFDPTNDQIQMLLEKCAVENLKLTMMNPPKITPKPSFMIGKVRNVKKIELVEIVAEPMRFNKLISIRHFFEKCFPNAQNHLSLLQQWN